MLSAVFPVRPAGLTDLNVYKMVDFKNFAVLAGQWLQQLMGDYGA